MMTDSPLAHFIQSLTVGSLWIGVKAVYLLAFFLYIAFSIVVISQVRQMTHTMKGGFEAQLEMVSWLHFGAAVLAFIWAFMVL